MAEDRLLSDEILLGLINKNKGGGGGTTNYNDLSNQPQINGETLSGNKTASDLGLATESALADKADKSAVKNEFLGTLDEWNALTEEQKKTYDTYQFTDDFMEGRYIYLPTIYSEEERQVGVWTDGKPLYQKTYRNISITNNADNIIDSNFGTDKNICTHDIEFRGISGNHRSDYNTSVNDTLYSNNGQLMYYFNKSGSWSQLFDTADITLQYTKTTDQPGSGTWTPDGQLAHHYSTSEKIVGTWIDGSTVYERTIDFGSDITIDNNWQTTSEPNTNMGKCISAILMSSSGNVRTSPSVQLDYGSYIRICYTNWTDTGRYLTIQYTKTE